MSFYYVCSKLYRNKNDLFLHYKHKYKLFCPFFYPYLSENLNDDIFLGHLVFILILLMLGEYLLTRCFKKVSKAFQRETGPQQHKLWKRFSLNIHFVSGQTHLKCLFKYSDFFPVFFFLILLWLLWSSSGRKIQLQ